MPKITDSRAFPYDGRDIGILVGNRDEGDTVYGPSPDDTGDGYNGPGNPQDSSRDTQGGDDNDQIFGGRTDDTIKGDEGLDALYGGDGNDSLYGGADTDWLFGEGDQDQLYGEDGSDQLYGGAGHDHLYGGEESDWLDGGTGDDLLVGGADADWLTGGSGYDQFEFDIAGNWFNPDSPAFNPDMIMDFSATDDVIVLVGSELEPLPANYVEDTIDYGAGYDAAKTQAMSLLSGDKTYAFVTDQVDGYLFIEPLTEPYTAFETVGIVLKGQTSVSDFDWNNVLSS
jgi:Ca2+-binding RTX toxin-like protein